VTDVSATQEMYGRLPWFHPEGLTTDQREYYDRLVSGPRKSWVADEQGRLHGAFNARLLDPAVGTAIQELGAVLRWKTLALTDRQRQVAILETLRHEQCEFEWGPHSRVALDAGLLPDQVSAIRHGVGAPTLEPAETLTRQVAQALLVERDIDDDLFDRAERELGLPALFDLVSLVAHYQHTALALRVWRVPVEEEVDGGR
jgi:4-carboxymuconolactone decarboxylase